MKKALITGITGQDGSYLAELLTEKGYTVHGLVMEEELKDPSRRLVYLQSILDKIRLHSIVLTDFQTINNVMADVQPDECYHFAAQTFVSYSQENESTTIKTNIDGTHNVLSALKTSAPHCRLFFPSSSEIFGHAPYSPQDELTPINPRSIYGVTKAAGYFMVKNYRENHQVFACNGILYNHESERRGLNFVTRKISTAVASIKLGRSSSIQLGNIEAKRDWGYAPEYVEAMWRMLQEDIADDYIIGTGETHSVKEFLEIAFGALDLDWHDHVLIDKNLYRPVEAVELKANAAKACQKLNWKPEVPFTDLVKKMVMADYNRLKNA